MGDQARRHPRRGGVGRRSRQLSALSRARRALRRRRLHDPLLHLSRGPRDTDLLGRMDPRPPRRALTASTRRRASSAWCGRARVSRFFGAIAILIPVVIYMYYVFIEAWCLGYAWSYLTGAIAPGADKHGLSRATSQTASTPTSASARTARCSTALRPALTSVVAICYALNFMLIYRGLVERHRDVLQVGDAGARGSRRSSFSCAC